MPQLVNGTYVYTPEELGIKPPPGGFQQGGWYQGRQYWNGVLSEPGVINPYSNQIGAGQPVSKEVIQQTNPVNWDYIQQQRQQTNLPPLPQTPSPIQTPTQPIQTGLNMSNLLPQKPTINLTDLYNKYFESDEIKQLKDQIKQRQEAYNKATSEINDNPFYSEATRVGRIAKLEEQYQRDIKALNDQLQLKLADAQTKLNLEMKQYDIDSQEYKDKLNLLNKFLDMGALINASASEISDFAVSLGVPTSFIQSIIEIQKKKQVDPKIITETDDNGNVSVVVIDANTGNIINQNSLGQIAKSSKSSSSSSTFTPTQQRDLFKKGAEILEEVDSSYQTINNKLKETFVNPDKRLSKQEYIKALEMFMSQTGVSDPYVADNYLSNVFGVLGYKKWKW